MRHRPKHVSIYHITDVSNLPGILTDDGLYSDAEVARRNPTVIGYPHIKERRLKEIRVACCGGRFVGEFVPFYFCPRSPMLYVINQGNTGRGSGSQQSIVHLVSSVAIGIELKRDWAISDGNASASYAVFSDKLTALEGLDWDAIGARDWQGKQFQKAAEFLVADFFPWTGIRAVGCHNKDVARQVQAWVGSHDHRPSVTVEPGWYY